MRTRRSTGWRLLQALTVAGFICASAIGYAEEAPPASDDQQSSQELSAPQIAVPDNPAHEDSVPQTSVPEPPAQQSPGPSNARPDTGNPSITLKGLLWRTKPGI